MHLFCEVIYATFKDLFIAVSTKPNMDRNIGKTVLPCYLEAFEDVNKSSKWYLESFL